MKQINQHGGTRANSGRKPKGTDGPRKVVQICLSPANAEYLAAKGRGKSDYVNLLLDRERFGWKPEKPSQMQDGEIKPQKKRGIYNPEGWPKTM